jgi:tRNA (uracil-5-)-methyltransferase
LLYKIAVEKVKQVSSDPENTLLFDVCCGTGTIGLTCMKEGAVGKVVGVDISAPAIDDARKNAVLNGYTCSDDSDGDCATRFVAAKAEDVLYSEIKRTEHMRSTRFVAIVDPARNGLHADVVKTIRLNEKIERLVYVSCNPTGSLVQDAALFCVTPTKKYRGRPFKIVSAQPVDMFPLTDHCEMVMVFDRMTEEEVLAAEEAQAGGENNPNKKR